MSLPMVVHGGLLKNVQLGTSDWGIVNVSVFPETCANVMPVPKSTMFSFGEKLYPLITIWVPMVPDDWLRLVMTGAPCFTEPLCRVNGTWLDIWLKLSSGATPTLYMPGDGLEPAVLQGGELNMHCGRRA